MLFLKNYNKRYFNSQILPISFDSDWRLSPNGIPMIVRENYALTELNSLGFSVSTKYFVRIETELQLSMLFEDPQWQAVPKYILGGGSNIVFTQDFPGLIIQMAIAGKEAIQTTAEAVLIEVGAGENWHELVTWSLAQHYPGLENLALIPGTVGAAPIQNIGAYGVELAQYCHTVRAYDTWQKKFIELTAQACQFSYRYSLFKQIPGRYIITQVRLSLPCQWQAQLAYTELAQAMAQYPNPQPEDIFSAILAIRTRKLPDPKKLGNVGSFFKNPTISVEQVNQLKTCFTNIPCYLQADGCYKLSAGWLIEQCGFKGIRRGSVGVYERQALVLVHFGQGNGAALLSLAQEIQDAVKARFAISLEPEPAII